METIWLAIKSHPWWAAIGGAGLVGVLAYAYLHKSSGSTQTQQDLLVAPATGGPAPIVSTNGGSVGSDGGSPSAIAPASPVNPVSPIAPASTIPPIAPIEPTIPADNPPPPAISVPPVTTVPNPAPPAPSTPPSATTPTPSNIVAPLATPTPMVYNVGIPPTVTGISSIAPMTNAGTSKPQIPAAVSTALATPGYTGTPLGPGTPVITGQATSTRVTKTSGGQTVKIAASTPSSAFSYSSTPQATPPKTTTTTTKPIMIGKTSIIKAGS